MNKSYIILLFIFFFSQSEAALIDNQSNFESDIEVGLVMNVISQPTSMRGATAFETPRVAAAFEFTQAEGNVFQFLLKGMDNKNAGAKKYQVEAEKASVVLKSYFPSQFWLELGLIANPWNEASEELWDFQFWGSSGNPALKRYKYLATSELGFNAHWNLGEKIGTTLSVMNGEAAQKDETGPRKDVQLIVGYEDETWQASLGYLKGDNDDDEPGINERERQLFRVAYIWAPVQITLELFKTKDSSRSIKDLGVAENLDVTALVNQSIEGQGGSLSLRWNYDENYTLRLRADQINPALKLDDVSVQSQIVAASYEPSAGTQFAVIYLRTSRGEKHSSASKTEERGMLALGMHF